MVSLQPLEWGCKCFLHHSSFLLDSFSDFPRTMISVGSFWIRFDGGKNGFRFVIPVARTHQCLLVQQPHFQNSRKVMTSNLCSMLLCSSSNGKTVDSIASFVSPFSSPVLFLVLFIFFIWLYVRYHNFIISNYRTQFHETIFSVCSLLFDREIILLFSTYFLPIKLCSNSACSKTVFSVSFSALYHHQ